MIRSALLLSTAFALVFAGFVVADQAPSGWTTDYAQAVKLAKESGKPIVANFTGSDWCAYCIKQEQEVFATEDFKKWAKDNAILLTVDFPDRKQQDAAVKTQNEKLKKQYQVKGYPTVLFISGEEKEIGRFVGYRPKTGAQKWIKEAQATLAAKK